MIRRVSRSARSSAAGFLCCVFAGLAPAAAWAADQCTGDGPRLNVVVDGLHSSRGDVVVEIYPDDSKRFLAHQAQVNSIHVKLDRLPPTVCLNVPAPGYYAMAVFHDENGDRKFNRNALGLPSEGFGLSNDPAILFGLPSFRAVRFQVGPGDNTVHVKVHYPGGK